MLRSELLLPTLKPWETPRSLFPMEESWNRIQSEDKVPIDKPYAYHKPSPYGLEAINKLRELYSQVERTIKEICPPSRHASLAITANEESAMWAIKAVVFNDPASEVEGVQDGK